MEIQNRLGINGNLVGMFMLIHLFVHFFMLVHLFLWQWENNGHYLTRGSLSRTLVLHCSSVSGQPNPSHLNHSPFESSAFAISTSNLFYSLTYLSCFFLRVTSTRFLRLWQMRWKMRQQQQSPDQWNLGWQKVGQTLPLKFSMGLPENGLKTKEIPFGNYTPEN